MTGDAQILHEIGLLSWKTAEVGFRRSLIDRGSLEELAVAELGRATITVSELAELWAVEQLSAYEIEDLLQALVARFDPGTDEETSIKRWCLGRLMVLSRESIDDEQLFDRMAEVDAEFGHPEELVAVSRYYFSPEDRAAGISSDKLYPTSPERLEEAIKNL